MDLSEYLNGTHPLLTLVGPFYTEGDTTTEPLVFVDGGSQFQRDHIGFCIGDGDSSTQPLDQTLPRDKDFSDLSYVLNQAKNQFSQINLFGFLGGRKDHELMNLAEVHTLLKNQEIETRVLFDDKIMSFSKGTWSVTINGTFSLFTFETNQVKLSGDCKYPISTPTLNPLSSHGLSNEGWGEVQLQATSPVFLFF